MFPRSYRLAFSKIVPTSLNHLDRFYFASKCSYRRKSNQNQNARRNNKFQHKHNQHNHNQRKHNQRKHNQRKHNQHKHNRHIRKPDEGKFGTFINSSKSKKSELQLKHMYSISQFSSALGIRTQRILRTLEKIKPHRNIKQNTKIKKQNWRSTDILNEELQELLAIEFDIDYINTESIDSKNSNEKAQPRPVVCQMICLSSVGISSLNKKIQDAATGNITLLEVPSVVPYEKSIFSEISDIVLLAVSSKSAQSKETFRLIKFISDLDIPLIVAIDTHGKNKNHTLLEELETDMCTDENNIFFVEYSSLNGKTFEDLIETLFLIAEMLDTKSILSKFASGIVADSQIKKGVGKIVQIIIKDGTICVGDFIISGSTYTKIRTMTDAQGKTLERVGSRSAVSITGFREFDQLKQKFHSVKSIDEAKRIVQMFNEKEYADEHFSGNQLQDELSAAKNFGETITNKWADNYRGPMMKSKKIVLPRSKQNAQKEKDMTHSLIIRCDNRSSLASLSKYVVGLRLEELHLEIALADVGTISPSDVDLANKINADIISCQKGTIQSNVKALASHFAVNIYAVSKLNKAMDQIKNLIEKRLPLVKDFSQIGNGVVRKTFVQKKQGKEYVIAGCEAKSGNIFMKKNFEISIKRKGKLLHSGKCSSLRHFADNVSEISSGQEFGISLEEWNDLQPDDIIECSKIKMVNAKIDDSQARKNAL